ncbi:hypothetical protein ACE3NQ_11080 [Paenibacillus terreus]|uniref:Uncharacterized protein n=1 Tax=Paenibacillus terreus TaxID=1387834 RepID=A0ABV5B6Y8_9BACL
MYVTADLKFAAIDAASGKIKWKASETDEYMCSYDPVNRKIEVSILICRLARVRERAYTLGKKGDFT